MHRFLSSSTRFHYELQSRLDIGPFQNVQDGPPQLNANCQHAAAQITLAESPFLPRYPSVVDGGKLLDLARSQFKLAFAGKKLKIQVLLSLSTKQGISEWFFPG